MPRLARSYCLRRPIRRAATALRLELPAEQPVRLEVLDVNGRRVRLLADRTMPAGRHELWWDGRDAFGRVAPAGVYWVVFERSALRQSRRIVRLH